MNEIKHDYLQQATLFELVMELRRRGANVSNFPDHFCMNFEMPDGEVIWSPAILIGIKDNEGACSLICDEHLRENMAERKQQGDG